MTRAAKFQENNWAIRLDWTRGTDATLSVTGRAEHRQQLEEFIRDLELAADLLGRAIEGRQHEQSERIGA